MKSGFWIFIGLCALTTACSSAPTEPPKETAPAWITQPPCRVEGNNLIYVGSGEDRVQANARFKAEAIALQDLANECSIIPKGTQIREDHFDQPIGIIYRSYAEVSVDLSLCLSSKNLTGAQADPTLTAEVIRYQNEYDASEPEEAAKLASAPAIQNPTRLFVVRQQIALAKQAGKNEPALPAASQAVANFENANPQTKAFSQGRPNWFNHQPSAVRETIMERARLEQAYPKAPPPAMPTPSKQGGRGKHRRQQQTPPPANPGGTPPAN